MQGNERIRSRPALKPLSHAEEDAERARRAEGAHGKTEGKGRGVEDAGPAAAFFELPEALGKEGKCVPDGVDGDKPARDEGLEQEVARQGHKGRRGGAAGA